MQHVIVTAISATTVVCTPNPIQIYHDDQFIRFSVGPDTVWGNDPINFGDTWPGGSANLDVSGTFIANCNSPLPDGALPATYSVSFKVVHKPTNTPLTHDPEVENQPQP